jgi:Mg-chelatase subunit ChlD
MRNWLLAVCLLAPSLAAATPCPNVMIVLDISASMDDTPSPGGTGPSKLDLAKTAILRLLSRYGSRMPFGLTTFSNPGGDCYSGIDVLADPADNNAANIAGQVQALVTTLSTNTGEAIKTVAALKSMHDASRPGSYIILITDGEPNCPDPTTAKEPAYTVSQIQAASDAGVKTFVIGFGQLPAADQSAMNMMAQAGGEPCTTCGSKKFYAAESDTQLNDAIDAISQQIVGEVGGLCDDSCYANPCPDPADICVQSQCKRNPCSGVSCPSGQYCYTDGNSQPVCTKACAGACPLGQSCQQGSCVVDPCATASCVMGQVCQNGACVTDPCSKMGCDSHYICKNGMCVDDPCRFVTCPQGMLCAPGTGQCAGTGPGGTGANHGRASTGGCALGGADVAPPLLAPLFVLGLISLRQRRERRRRA